METEILKKEKEKLERSKHIISSLIKGDNPFNSEKISEDSILKEEKIKRCFEYILEALELVKLDKRGMDKLKKNMLLDFSLTKEQKDIVVFPEYPIGIVEFAKCVNMIVDKEMMKEVSPRKINEGLKKMGILHEVTGSKSTRTIINPDVAKEYGISVMKYEKNGIKIEKIVYDDIGKKFLLDNIEKILENAK